MQDDLFRKPWSLSPMNQEATLLRNPLQGSTCTALNSKPTTASQILATFSPKQQRTKPTQQVFSGPQAFPIVMEGRRQSRNKAPVSYEISSDSDDAGPSSQVDSSFSSPEKPVRKRVSLVDLEDEDEPEEITPPKTPPPRLSSAGHSLRQHANLHLSVRAQENADKPRKRKRKVLKSVSKLASKDILQPLTSAPRTARTEVREQIAAETAVQRAKFFVAKRDLFLPLLPENNHVQRLVATHKQNGIKDQSVPYEVLEKQPIGVKAIMKPYQILGLSFLVYLHKNGLSGILGDEMGLGKTLQTLSLVQYLKENRKQLKTHAEIRPSLVVCPLSVLSSWMAESRRWTPDLKVLRFHGPGKERDRMKKVATGETDMYGNVTRLAKKKRNDRRTATGKPIIDLDSDTDDIIDEPSVDLIVTTYEGFLAEQSWFKKAFVWSYVILDEGHKIKNDLSLISKALQGLGAEYRLILTGTPLQNNLTELWALLHWLYPEVFTEKSAELFKESFNLTKGQVSTKVMDDARKLLEIIMLRRMKNSPGVDLNLPPKTEVLLYVPLTPMQRFWYMRLLTRADQGLLEELFSDSKEKESIALADEAQQESILQGKDLVELETLDTSLCEPDTAAEWKESKEIMRQALEKEREDANKSSAWRKLMNILMQLRKCCNHPYILPHAEPDPYYLGEHVIHASAKFIVLDKIIDELVLKQKKKVLIFSGFTRMLDCCEDFLALRGGTGDVFKYVRLDGSTSRARRNLGIRMFNKEDTNYRIMLISTRAGGLGINLATPSDVIMLDQDWNPQIMLQAEARAHRIGQTKPVTVYKLCTQGTVEEQMMGRIQKKLYLSAKVTESMRDLHSSPKRKKGPGGKIVDATEDDMPQLGTSQLMSLVRRGAQALAHPELDINDMLGWDWPTMLEKCKDKPADIHVSEQTQSGIPVQEEDEKKWLAKIEQVESRVFQGKKHKKVRDSDSFDGIAAEWSRESRRIGKNTTVQIDGYTVSKESANCADWEAVPTLAGKDPRLAEVKREKKPIVVNQEHCQVCWDGGDLILCSGCPRAYHYRCLDREFQAKSKGSISFNCPQHRCADCEQNTSEAGGMLYRCRWCERGYCEDCLDWEKTELIGENLKEYELLGFPSVAQAFYISCPSCYDHHVENPEAREFCAQEATKIDTRYMEEALAVAAAGIAANEAPVPTPADSLTDAPTLSSSGLTTPQRGSSDDSNALYGRKRKAAPTSFTPMITPVKRSKRIVSSL